MIPPFQPGEVIRAAKLNAAIADAGATASVAALVSPSIIGWVPRTVSERTAKCDVHINDFGGGGAGIDTALVFNKINAYRQTFDPSLLSAFTVWFERTVPYEFYSTLTLPRGTVLRSIDGIQTAVLNFMPGVWTSPGISIPNDAVWFRDISISGVNMQAGSEPIVVLDSALCRFENVTVQSGGQTTGVRLQNGSTLEARRLTVSCGDFNRASTADRGLIEVSDDCILRAHTVTFAGNGSGGPHLVSGVKITGARYVELGGPLVTTGTRELVKVDLPASANLRMLSLPDGFVARNLTGYAIDVAVGSSARVQDVHIGPSRTEGTTHQGGFKSGGVGYVDNILLDHMAVYDSIGTNWAIDIRTGAYVCLRSPIVTGSSKAAVLIGDGTRPMDTIQVFGGRIGPLGTHAGNNGSGLNIGPGAHGTLFLQGCDLRGNVASSLINSNTGGKQSIDVFV